MVLIVVWVCLGSYIHVHFIVRVWCGVFFFFKQKTAYEMRISDWSSDVCSSDLQVFSASPSDGVCTVGTEVSSRLARSSSPRIAITPPARCTSSRWKWLDGATLHRFGTLRDKRSMSPMLK